MNINQLIKEANKELDLLLNNISEEELEKLEGSLGNLNGTDPHNCIYGLITGNCNSPRAMELMQLCDVKYYDWGGYLSTTNPWEEPRKRCVIASTPLEFILYERDDVYEHDYKPLLNSFYYDVIEKIKEKWLLMKQD